MKAIVQTPGDVGGYAYEFLSKIEADALVCRIKHHLHEKYSHVNEGVPKPNYQRIHDSYKVQDVQHCFDDVRPDNFVRRVEQE